MPKHKRTYMKNGVEYDVNKLFELVGFRTDHGFQVFDFPIHELLPSLQDDIWCYKENGLDKEDAPELDLIPLMIYNSQYDDNDDVRIHRKSVEVADTRYPILVEITETGQIDIVDGYHRLLKLYRIAEKEQSLDTKTIPLCFVTNRVMKSVISRRERSFKDLRVYDPPWMPPSNMYIPYSIYPFDIHDKTTIFYTLNETWLYRLLVNFINASKNQVLISENHLRKCSISVRLKVQRMFQDKHPQTPIHKQAAWCSISNDHADIVCVQNISYLIDAWVDRKEHIVVRFVDIDSVMLIWSILKYRDIYERDTLSTRIFLG